MPPPITTNAAAEAASLEEQIAAERLMIGRTANRSRRWGGRNSTRLRTLEDRLYLLQNNGTPPDITPAPDSGPTFASARAPDPMFSGPRLDTGRVGVDALKIISYPSSV